LALSVVPTGLAPVERWLGHPRAANDALVQKSPLHRGKPGGGEQREAHPSCAQSHAPPGQARWGRNPGSPKIPQGHEGHFTFAPEEVTWQSSRETRSWASSMTRTTP